jgi:phosphate transport system substrate-binding protein
MSSRAIKDSEFEVFPNLQVFTIAYDGIAIVTNPAVELPTLSIDEVRAIFSGAITNFSDVGGTDAPITIVSREEGSGTRAAFEDLVMKYKDNTGEKVTDLIAEAALLQQSNGQVRTIVAETPNSIGYLSFGFLDDAITGVPIDDVAPSIVNVLNGSYPIFRPLNMETGGEPSDLAKAFLDFILSTDGQAIVAEDYIPIE